MHTQSNYRLLVVRLGAMGDILHALPAVTSLRQLHPSWTIDWVVEPRWRPLLSARAEADDSVRPATAARYEDQPLVDHIFAAPVKEWGRRPLAISTLRAIQSLRANLKDAGYNAVLDFQGAVRSAAIGRMAASARLIGEDKPRESIAKWLFTERVDARGAHVIEQDDELAAAVAGDLVEFRLPVLPVSAAAESWADAILPRSTGPAALITPGAGWGAKRWPVERYAQVAAGLVARGFRVLVNAGPGEERLAAEIVRGTAGAAIPVVCTLDQLIALTRRIALAVAGDTGPLHLACALGCPVVGIYGPTDPSRNGPFGTRFRVLRSPESRRDHTRHAMPEAGMLTIMPDDVLRAADELMNEPAQESSR